MESKIQNILSEFRAVGLNDINSVELLNRTDKKYILNISELNKILEQIKNDYFVLEINNIRFFKYETTYYDTNELFTYIKHHNGISKRFKIRKRNYVDTGTSFFEIKLKTNKGKTNKKRLNLSNSDDPKIEKFLKKLTGFSLQDLYPKLYNKFNRVTLIDNFFTERITIDTGIFFKTDEKELKLNSLCIIETKFDKNNRESAIRKILKEQAIKETGFSKYCMGTALLKTNVKQNRFKANILKLNKLTKTN